MLSEDVQRLGPRRPGLDASEKSMRLDRGGKWTRVAATEPEGPGPFGLGPFGPGPLERWRVESLGRAARHALRPSPSHDPKILRRSGSIWVRQNLVLPHQALECVEGRRRFLILLRLERGAGLAGV